MRWRAFARLTRTSSLAALACSVSLARAEPGSAPLGRHEAPRGGGRGSEAPLEAPRVRLTVDPSGDFTWVLRVENTDTIPLRLVGNARLLSLDVTPASPARAATVHCTLPEEMRPSSDEDNEVVLPPQLSYVETFDPRLYCFEVRQERALTTGAKVVARFGFVGQRWNRAPPYVVTFPSPTPDRASAKEIASEPFILPERSPSLGSEVYPPRKGGDLQTPEAEPAPGPTPLLAVSTPRRLDSASFSDLTLPVAVTNSTSRPVSLLLRPETIAILATGPYGSTRCQWLVVPSPIPELFTTLAPNERVTTDVLVSSLCPAGFFDRAGLYALRAVVDTRRVSGATIGIRSFVGEVTAKSATLLRLQRAPRTGKDQL
jgi:hypothetical protein